MQALSTNNKKYGRGRPIDIVCVEPIARQGKPLVAMRAIEANFDINASPAPAARDDSYPAARGQIVPDRLNQFLGGASR